jgi:hypothetical protein
MKRFSFPGNHDFSTTGFSARRILPNRPIVKCPFPVAAWTAEQGGLESLRIRIVRQNNVAA